MPWMKIRGEITSFDVTPKEQVEDESLRQKDSYRTQLWRAFTSCKPPKKQVGTEGKPGMFLRNFLVEGQRFLTHKEISVFLYC